MGSRELRSLGLMNFEMFKREIGPVSFASLKQAVKIGELKAEKAGKTYVFKRSDAIKWSAALIERSVISVMPTTEEIQAAKEKHDVLFKRSASGIKAETPPALGSLSPKNLFLFREENAIYFLCDGDEIVYVGKSVKLTSRIHEHLKSHKAFDRVFFVNIDKQFDLSEAEEAFILHFNPKYNRTKERPAPIHADILNHYGLSANNG